jgi:tetratricopeptide (TPR) repeat protein
MVPAAKDSGERLGRAYSALAAGDLAVARPAYEAILKDSPRELDALLGLAFIERTQGRPAEARTLYQRALALRPGQLDAQLGLLSVTAELGLDDPAVLAQARELAQARPDSAAVQFAAGQLMALKGDLPSATALLGRAAALQPSNSLYLFNWAVALDRSGRHAQALQAYRQVLQGEGAHGSEGPAAQGVDRDLVRRRIEALAAAWPATDPGRP